MKTAICTASLSLLFAGAAFAQTPVGTTGTSTTTTAPAGDSTAPAATSNDYRLAAGDKLRIDVYKDAQLTQPSVQVRPDGKVTLPLVGDIVAAGRTSTELRDAIATALTEYIANPTVTVIVTETMPQVVYVTGEVNKPGPYTMGTGQLNILQALAMAGGLTDFANRKDIRVMRKGPSGMQTLKFNYKDALESTREPLQLRAGDTVVVK
jgi:polysaccharide biosynthesis/export protein